MHTFTRSSLLPFVVDVCFSFPHACLTRFCMRKTNNFDAVHSFSIVFDSFSRIIPLGPQVRSFIIKFITIDHLRVLHYTPHQAINQPICKPYPNYHLISSTNKDSAPLCPGLMSVEPLSRRGHVAVSRTTFTFALRPIDVTLGVVWRRKVKGISRFLLDDKKQKKPHCRTAL